VATVHDADLADILALAGQEQIKASGLLNADIHIAGAMANPQGAAQLTVVNGILYDEPFDRLQASVEMSDQLVNLRSAQLVAGAARIDLQGVFNHPRESFEVGRIQLHTNSNQVQLSQFKTLQKQRPGLAGVVNLKADVSGDIHQVAETPSSHLSRLTQT